MTSTGEMHYSETYVPDKISGTILITDELRPSVLIGLRNCVVQVQLASGLTAILRNAMFTGDAGLESKDGRFNIEFTGIGKYV
jgi:hypothetical protein